LRLAQDPELGEIALTELRSRIRPEALLSGMTSAITGHARTVFHRLGRALHADIPVRFLQQWELAPFVEGLATSTPTAALEVCAEVARTLTDADLPDAGAMIAAEAGGAEKWARRLRFGRQQEAFTQAIRDLTALDRATAGDVVDRLRATPTHITIGNRPANALLARLRHALLDGPTVAPAMLRAIHEVRPQVAADLLVASTKDLHATYVFRGDIQQLQDPVAQSAAARNLVRVGVSRGSSGSGWIDSVHDIRMQAMHRFTGPRPVTALLRMLATWDAGWGAAAAQSVNVERIRRRLRYGALTDVADAIELARTMAALDNEAVAQQLFEELHGLEVTRIGEHLDVGLLCSLVDVLHELMPDAVPQFSRGLSVAVRSLVGRAVVLDECAQWMQVGRAFRILRQVGAPAVQVGEPRIAPNIVYAPAIAWAATGVNQPGWGDNALDRSASRLVSRPLPPDVTDQACVLSATGRGWAPELRASRTEWDIATAPFWLLRILYAEEASDPYLVPILALCEATILERANRDSARPDWDASRLRLMLGARASARTRPTTDTAAWPSGGVSESGADQPGPS
jgi:hypothetical protein